jgi:murein L,D-transpeptidase YafK
MLRHLLNRSVNNFSGSHIPKGAMKKYSPCCIVVLLFGLCALAEGQADSLPMADRIIIRKSERMLFLEQDGQVFREYSVSLGMNPIGHKQRRGDKRTPEGSYVISHHLPGSMFYKALLISYPNRDDIRAARRKGYDPGGLIMIHGLPEAAKGNEEDFFQRDWTNGCIAVTNDAIDQIWNLVKDGTPVDILP